MTQAYINGFMRKCAEHGVDGAALLKRAQLTPEEHLEFRKLKGLTTDNADVLYQEYRKKRRIAKIMTTVLMGLHGSVLGLTAGNKSGDGATGALIGGGVGALAGYGLGSLGTSMTDAAVRNNIKNNKAGKPASWWAMTEGI